MGISYEGQPILFEAIVMDVLASDQSYPISQIDFRASSWSSPTTDLFTDITKTEFFQYSASLVESSTQLPQVVSDCLLQPGAFGELLLQGHR
jgi:hypothetical protein